MQSDTIPPVQIEEKASSFKPMQIFATHKQAVDFIQVNGGLLVKDTLKERYFVIRIPKRGK